MDDHDLIRRLHAAADTAVLTPDLDAVERSAGRARARRRWATGVAAAMLVAGAGGAGFGLGHAAGSGDRDQAAEGERLAVPATTGPGEPTASTVAAPSTEPPGEAAPAATVVAPTPHGSEAPPAPGEIGGVTVNVGDEWVGSLGGTPLALQYTRDWNGVRVRALSGDGWGQGTPDWQPPDWCFPSGELRVTVDSAELVDLVGFGYFTELAPGTVVRATRGEVGWADGRPLRLVVVQAAQDVASVSVTWNDGASDSAPVDNGIAVLVVDGGGAWEDGYTLTYSSSNGDVSLPAEQAEGAITWSPDCSPPPPALPEPGEQPADVAAAEQALRDGFARMWDDLRDGVASVHIDDPAGVAEALAEVREGGYAEAAASAVHTVEEISFTSPTEAWFRYAIETSSGRFGERYGTASLGDAGWVFPRAVPCQDIGLGGGSCDPMEAPIYPPSWYEQNGVASYGACEQPADGGMPVCTSCTADADVAESCSEDPVPIGVAPATLVPTSEAPAP